MIHCLPASWRDRTAARERAATRALRLVPTDGVRGGDERDSRRTGNADGEREFNPYGLMAWWPQA